MQLEVHTLCTGLLGAPGPGSSSVLAKCTESQCYGCPELDSGLDNVSREGSTDDGQRVLNGMKE